MVHTKSRLEVFFVRPKPPFNNNPQPSPVSVEAEKEDPWNSRHSHFAPPRRKQFRKYPLIAHPLCKTHERDVHLRTDYIELRMASTLPLLPALTPSTGRSIQRVIILIDRRTPRMVWQCNEAPNVVESILLKTILYVRVWRGKPDR